jgi:transposase
VLGIGVSKHGQMSNHLGITKLVALSHLNHTYPVWFFKKKKKKKKKKKRKKITIKFRFNRLPSKTKTVP